MTVYKKAFIMGLITLCAVVGILFLSRLAFGGGREESPPAQPAVTPEYSAPESDAVPETPEPPENTTPDREPRTEPVLMASAHFAMEEYACDCLGYCDGWPTAMNPELLEKIEALRCHFDRPVIITSGVRCESRNEEVGGVSWSFHKRGCAADLYCPGVAVGDVALAAKELGMNILPYYSQGYVHVEING